MSACRSAATSCSRCSGRTAPARRRCSTSSAPSSSPTAAPRGSAASTSSPSRLAARRSLGVVFQEPSLDDRLTVYENLNFHGLVYGVPAGRRKSRIDEMLHLVELTDWRDALVRTLSAGMKRRLEIARALVHDARVLFLDEPTVGLDAQSRGRLWQHVQALRGEARPHRDRHHPLHRGNGELRPRLHHRPRPHPHQRRADGAQGARTGSSSSASSPTTRRPPPRSSPPIPISPIARMPRS